MDRTHSARWAIASFLWVAQLATGQGVSATAAARGLRQTSEDVEALARKVSPAVVKILVTGYGPVEEEGHENTAVVARQHSIGSGVIIDPKGYIITNAHVVAGAQRIQVVLNAGGEPRGPAARPRILSAKVAGVDKNTDLAVLKIDAAGLAALPFGDYASLRQGQVVLAFGSPEGLENSVTMGIVSSPMRQPDPDRPVIFIQTDAAINPGNSGGPLVDIAGNVVGINTYILSQSGGSEGLGFAIPSAVARFVYQEILAHGHVHRRMIGVHLQAITPVLARGLGLTQDWGLLASDVAPGGPADTAGLRIRDIVTAVDHKPAQALPALSAALYHKSHGDAVTLEVLRGSQKLTLEVAVAEEPQSDFDDLAGLADPDKSLVPALGILGIEVTGKIADALSELRIRTGVLVAANAADARVTTGLRAGDVIHSINGMTIRTLDELRAAVGLLSAGDAVAIQVERGGRLTYLAFEVE